MYAMAVRLFVVVARGMGWDCVGWGGVGWGVGGPSARVGFNEPMWRCCLPSHRTPTHKGGGRPPPLSSGVWGLGRQQAHQNIESGKGKLWGWTSA